ncbi:MAG: hypothetical protein O2958_02715 [Gemmatimonadetes bacterium]|nr:hypothetical protein [Gemmatimonadota bacterium]MDA1101981.1 hypothetical protein [Gemmatimonadota bacterium]
MSTPHENAQTLMRLYEIRRDPKLREARNWCVRSFNPSSPEDVVAAMGSENGVFLRMAAGYWDMAATFVVHGALDAPMFYDTCGELLAMYCKVEHMIEEVRAATGQPGLFKNVEQVAKDWPGAPERMVAMREYFASLAASA